MIAAAFQNLRRRLWTPSVLAPLALALIGALGLIFRLSDLAARDLWTDEAWVALAALKASPGAALAAGQSTPPFYLLTVWAAAKILGGQEWVLRFPVFRLRSRHPGGHLAPGPHSDLPVRLPPGPGRGGLLPDNGLLLQGIEAI